MSQTATAETNDCDASSHIIDTAPKGIPIETILEYRKKKLSCAEIGVLLGCDKSNISRRLQPYQDDIDNLDLYKTHRADIIALTGRQILKHLTPDRLEKASAYQLAGMYGILYDKERLERGQSTANIHSIHDDIAAIKSLKGDI